MKKICLILIFCLPAITVQALSWWPFAVKQQATQGNHHSQSFYAVKKEMLEKIYYDHRQTLYCDAEFTAHKKIIKPHGFKLPNLRKVNFKVYDIAPEELQRKAERMEWEHIVPAQNFGKTFTEWQNGHKNCTFGKGAKYKGRACAEQENEEFRYMYTDMYNLYPAIGAVNYLRANFNFTQFDDKVANTFGQCALKIAHNKAEPPDGVKGLIARTYLYMEKTYPRYKIGEPMRGILTVWNKKYPLTMWECQRASRIEKVQGNANQIIKPQCIENGWYKS